MNYTGLITTQTKFQEWKMKEKIHVQWAGIASWSTKLNFLLGLEESFQKMYPFTLLSFVVFELQLIKIKCVVKHWNIVT